MVPADPASPMSDATAGDADPPVRARRRIPVVAISVALIALFGGSTLFLSGYALGRQAAAEPGTPAALRTDFQPFWDTYQAITDRYAGGAVDRATLIQGAIRGMITSLGDPFSAYLTSDEYLQSLQGISGQFEGIGAEIASQATDGTQGCTPLGPACRLLVTNPIPGSPAERAGIRAGDIVASVGGASLDGLTLDAARDRIRGPKGSVVTITVDRRGSPALTLSITRDVVQAQEVESRTLAGGSVGYIRLVGFSDAAADDVVKALQAHLAGGRPKLVLDLRGNPGGFVTAARKIASQFIASGPIFWEQDAKGTQISTDALDGGVATGPGVRLVVLIDGGTASASEIVAGALQDTKRAALVGRQSFGKGTVQQWQELSGQAGAFKLTIARWLTPDKRWIHKIGLTPDAVVALPNPLPTGADPDLDRALELLGSGPQGAVFQAAA